MKTKYIQLPLSLFVQLHPDVLPPGYLDIMPLAYSGLYIVRFLPDFSLIEIGFPEDVWTLG